MGQAREQIFAEAIGMEVHHGLVKVEIESRGGPVDLLVPFNVFFRAEREARKLVAKIDSDSRGRVAPACALCKDHPPGEH